MSQTTVHTCQLCGDSIKHVLMFQLAQISALRVFCDFNFSATCSGNWQLEIVSLNLIITHAALQGMKELVFSFYKGMRCIIHMLKKHA